MEKIFVNGNVYRFTGDEFLVIVEDMSNEMFTNHVVKLQKRMQKICDVSIGFVWSDTNKQLDELIAHADAEDRELLILHRLTDVLNGSITGVGIAGTIGDKQSVELQPVEIIVPGNADDFHPPSQQTADDVSLHTAIHKDNLL